MLALRKTSLLSAAICGSENNAQKFSSAGFSPAKSLGATAIPAAAIHVRRKKLRREIGGKEIGMKKSLARIFRQTRRNSPRLREDFMAKLAAMLPKTARI